MTIPDENIVLDMNYWVSDGAYGDIFKLPEGNLVCKLFIGCRHKTNVNQGLINPKDDHYRQRTFDSECRAYEIASQDVFLREHIPASFRRCKISDVLEYDESVAGNYLLDCCYVVEYIDSNAPPAKLRAVAGLSHIEEALTAFDRVGIAHTSDASVFFAEDPQKFKFIDFAVEAHPFPHWLI
jgi:hypothetical protein